MQAPVTKRVKIVTGFRCNANCIFCYYKDRLKQPNLSYESIKRDIDFAFRHGKQYPFKHHARDYLIGTISITTGSILITENVRHFQWLVDEGYELVRPEMFVIDIEGQDD